MSACGLYPVARGNNASIAFTSNAQPVRGGEAYTNWAKPERYAVDAQSKARKMNRPRLPDCVVRRPGLRSVRSLHTLREVIVMAAPSDNIEVVTELFDRRAPAIQDLADHAEDVAGTCHAMAVRFHRGGKLIVFGNGSPCTDAQHVAVEFVHPVIVGKRALPAVSLTSDAATFTGVATRDGLDETFAHQIRCLAEPADIALGLSTDGNCANVLRGLECAAGIGMLTVALAGNDGGAITARNAADHVLLARHSDPRVIKEVHVTTYHILWELVHVFFEQPGVLDPEMVAH